MMKLSIILILALTGLTSGFAHGQTAPDTPASSGSQTPTAQPTAADVAFEKLEKELRAINTSLRNKGGVEPSDKPILSAISARVDEFSKQFSDDPRGPAAQLMIAEWLGEQDRIDTLYGQLLQRTPDNQQLRIAFAQRLKEANRFAESIEVLQGHTFDNDHIVQAMTLLSDCLFADNRFTESVDALKSLSPEILAANPGHKPQIDENLKTRAEYVELWNAEQTIRQAEDSANDLPRVIFTTPRGTITLELFENEAPNTVANFIKLTEAGFYNGTKFHRVLANPPMAQGGDPNTKPDASASAVPGMGDPGYKIEDEYSLPNARKHFAGSLSMANTGAPNTGGSQFFITHQPTPHLNGKHTVFGRVIDGLPAARAIKQDDVLENAVVLRKRDHPYEPNVIPTPTSIKVEPVGSIGNPIDITDLGQIGQPPKQP